MKEKGRKEDNTQKEQERRDKRTSKRKMITRKMEDNIKKSEERR